MSTTEIPADAGQDQRSSLQKILANAKPSDLVKQVFARLAAERAKYPGRQPRYPGDDFPYWHCVVAAELPNR